MTYEKLRIGDKVTVTRANGVTVHGVVKSGPLKYLMAFGEFYIIRNPAKVFMGKKDVSPVIGMYAREYIRREGGMR